MLSQMTTHPSFNRVYKRVKEKSGSWDDYLQVPISELEALIKDAGLSNQKGPRIKAILERVNRDFGCVSLDALYQMSDVEVEGYLTSLPGVGTKTAKCVMMYSLGRQVLPVDTHVARVARRLGLVSGNVSSSRVHDALEEVINPEDRYAFHVNAVSHGREVCLALHPRCSCCPLNDLCPFPIDNNSNGVSLTSVN
jgi:endonuclease III